MGWILITSLMMNSMRASPMPSQGSLHHRKELLDILRRIVCFQELPVGVCRGSEPVGHGHTPFFPRERLVSPRDAFVPPTIGTSSDPRSSNQRIHGFLSPMSGCSFVCIQRTTRSNLHAIPGKSGEGSRKGFRENRLSSPKSHLSRLARLRIGPVRAEAPCRLPGDGRREGNVKSSLS